MRQFTSLKTRQKKMWKVLTVAICLQVGEIKGVFWFFLLVCVFLGILKRCEVRRMMAGIPKKRREDIKQNSTKSMNYLGKPSGSVWLR